MCGEHAVASQGAHTKHAHTHTHHTTHVQELQRELQQLDGGEEQHGEQSTADDADWQHQQFVGSGTMDNLIRESIGDRMLNSSGVDVLGPSACPPNDDLL